MYVLPAPARSAFASPPGRPAPSFGSWRMQPPSSHATPQPRGVMRPHQRGALPSHRDTTSSSFAACSATWSASTRWQRRASQSAAQPAVGGGPSLPRPRPQRSGYRNTRPQALLHPAGGDLEPPLRGGSSGGRPGRGPGLGPGLSTSGGGSPNSSEAFIDVEAESVDRTQLAGDGRPGSKRPPSLFIRLFTTMLRAISTVAGLVLSWPIALWRDMMRNKWTCLMSIVTVFVLFLSPLSNAFLPNKPITVITPQEVVYSRFRTAVDAGQVRSARFDDGSRRVYFELRPDTVKAAMAEQGKLASYPQGAELPVPRLFSKRVDDPHLIAALLKAGVEFGAVKSTLMGAVWQMFGTAFALWIPCLPIFFLMRRALNAKTGTKKRSTGTKTAAPPITFQDVAGVDSAKEELREVVACLKDAGRYARLNARMPSGVLLTGAPGTGKTLLAKAVAGEAGVPFFAASASEFVELFVGRGAARIRELFAEARKKAPCVIFIDELDAVGGKRGLGLNEERDQTLNQLLTELDGFEGRTGVLLLAATNRPEVLDPALTRPGRLSRRVVVPLPDEAGRAAILAVHMRDKPLARDINAAEVCDLLSKLTRGFSGAELANVVNEAALLAGRRGMEAVALPELLEGVQRTKYGVNGSGSPLLVAGSWQRKLQDWLVERASSSRPIRTSPMGQS